ncbi:protein PALS2-like [Babylonia areolata]|uniref:protein PALS2-like n=1 Tax=Babylonia areolata TaxID=304850 RepID=UPI003FD43B6F
MPTGKKTVSAIDALETIQDNIGTFEDEGASEAEADFLQDFFENPALGAILEMYDDLTTRHIPDPQSEKGREVMLDVLDIVTAHSATNGRAAQLKDLLGKPHMKGLIMAHDDVAQQNYGDEPQMLLGLSAPPPPVFDTVGENHTLITITKQGKQPLGITVNLDRENNLKVARILQGSLADRQGLLHVGDMVREVNGTEVYTPEDMMHILKDAATSVTMKIVPCHREDGIKEKFFVRANFSYDPMNDRLLPCKKVGLPFRQNDILEVVSTADENWWQARSVAVTDGHGPVGIIPSRTLQEKRSAFVQPALTNTKTSLLCGLKMKKKKQIDYSTNNNKEYDDCDIKVYEEVTLTNYHTRVLALVGARNVGKQSLIKKLVEDNPRRFQAAIPYTSRPMGEKDIDGHGYFFIDRETMERDIRENKYVDYGEFDGHLYGIKFSTVRAIVKTGRVCVMAVNPVALKMLKSPDLQPYIVLIAAPSIEALKVLYEEHRLQDNPVSVRSSRSSRATLKELFQEEMFIQTVQESQLIEKSYRSYFDETIVNDDFNTTYEFLRDTMSRMHQNAKWVPVDWK